MTIKELKEKIQDLPDEGELRLIQDSPVPPESVLMFVRLETKPIAELHIFKRNYA